MEKTVSVAVPNEKACNFLPHDVVLFILSKLPLKLLKRFQSVCKSWSLMFKNPHFINMYINHLTRYNHSSNDDTFFVLHKLLPGTYQYEYQCIKHCEFYWLSNETFENRVKLDWPPQFQKDDTDIYIVGSVSINGILCLKQGFNYTRQLVLWNPTTGGTMSIAPSPVENIPSDRSPSLFLHGFGYDHVNDDYKVIQMIDFFPAFNVCADGDLKWEDRSYDPLWEIYSLKSNSWKKLNFDIRNCYYYSELRGMGVYMDGLCHWWAKSESKKIEDCLLSFDFSTEVLFTTPMSSDIEGRFHARHAVRNLVMLNGSITLISSSYLEPTTFGISILGKVGVKESWTHLFIVGRLPFVEFPIRVGKTNNLVSLEKFVTELIWVDLRTQVIGELRVNGKKLGDCQMGKYKKSFVPIGRINS